MADIDQEFRTPGGLIVVRMEDLGDGTHASGVIPRIKRDDDTYAQTEADNLFNAPIGIDVAHHEVHEGVAFNMFKCDTAMANNDTIEIGFITPGVSSPQKRCHAILTWRAAGTGNVAITEGVTSLGAGSGANLVPLNHQRGSSAVSAVTLPVTGQTGAAITYAGGSEIWAECWGGASANVNTSREIAERVLAPATAYVFTLENTSGGSQAGHLAVFWYEHIDA